MVDSSSSNPLPSDAEHSPAPMVPSSATESNPLPDHAEHTPAVRPVDASNANPIGVQAQVSKSASASNDSLVPALGYLPGIFQLAALIGLLGQNARAKFHGAQALVYWLIMVLLYIPILVLTGSLAFMAGAIGGLIGLLVLVVYGGVGGIVVPLYMLWQTYQGNDIQLPVIGKFIAGKMSYNA